MLVAQQSGGLVVSQAVPPERQGMPVERSATVKALRVSSDEEVFSNPIEKMKNQKMRGVSIAGQPP
jgi:hypothetical protein